MSRIFEALTEASKQRSETNTEALSHQHLSGSATAEYKLLRERIVKLTPDLNQRAVLFVSPSGDKGSLEVVTNFCLTLSRAGEKVLLVEINMGESYMREIFGISEVPDITEIFAGKCTIRELIHGTIYSNLFLLSGDTLVTNPFSPEERHMLGTAADDMKAIADWIILGCPSVNLPDTTATLAAIVDGTILVIEAEKTRRGVARRAREHLEKAGANVLGAVLNNRKNYMPDWINRLL